MVAARNLSRFLSYALRHDPSYVDGNGWADVQNLLERAGKQGYVADYSALVRAVQENEKQRFSLSEDGTKIRANQGHSFTVDLGLEEQQPPEALYHGTVDRFLPSIFENGLQKMSRQHVHLSADRLTALVVGRRRGRAVVLSVVADAMYRDGHKFFRSENGVWLTNSVPPQFLKQEPDDENG